MSYVLGLSGAYFHDASACLVRDGQIIAFVEEERFTRRKHNKDSQSSCRSAAFCLSKAGIRLDEVKAIALCWNPNWPHDAEYVEDKDFIQELLDPRFFNGYTPKRLKIIEHHLAHAASAFYCSGFSEANILVVDGSGDGVSTSLSYGGSEGICFIRKYDFTQSLGWFYESITEHIGLGDWSNVGKLMGLAAYGKSEYSLDFLRQVPGGYEIDLSAFGIDLASDSTLDYWRLKKAFKQALDHYAIPSQSQSFHIDANSGKLINKTEFTAIQQNVAASAQQKLEVCVMALAESLISNSGNRRLCIAGGTGLNCSVNGKLYSNTLVEDLYVQPASGDAGCAIGAALEVSRQIGDLTMPLPRMRTTSFGPSFSNETIYTTLKTSGLPFTFHPSDIEYVTAQAMANGAVVGWFQGPMEGGPRALGNRSILADPRQIAKRDQVNLEIKHRELWRPLAPSILETRINDYAPNVGPSEFMIVAYQASPMAQEKIPATIHVDGTMRPQSVQKATNPRYTLLLEAFETITGVPAVLNTSFNQEAEPIVCTPIDAIRTFCSVPLDVLAIGDFLVTKKRLVGIIDEA